MRILTLGLAVALAVMGCGLAHQGQPTARLIWPGEGGAGMALDNTRPHSPYSFGDVTVCLDRPGQVVIDSVWPVQAYGGLTVDAFAVIPNPREQGRPGFGDSAKSLTARHVDVGGPTIVDHECPDPNLPIPPHPNGATLTKSLLFEVSKPTDASAGDRALLVGYTSGGHHYALIIPFDVELCAPGDTTTEWCG